MNEGRIVQVGTPDQVYEAPTSRFAAEFIGSTNLLEGVLQRNGARLFTCADLEVPLQVPDSVSARTNRIVQISLRPERIALSFERVDQPANWAVGTIDQYAYMGSYTLYYVRLKSGRLMAVDMSRLAVRALERAPDYGDTVYLRWGPDHLVVLDQ
jgi:putrescine transport system ATP-binding protein